MNAELTEVDAQFQLGLALAATELQELNAKYLDIASTNGLCGTNPNWLEEIRILDFARAIIEDYKASLVPVAYIHLNEYDEYRLEPIDTFNVKDIPKNVDTKLYALGETK